jgi:hypothetical protein
VRGSAAREYIVTQGALLLDEEVIHHHWFLALRSRNGSFPVVVPREGGNVPAGRHVLVRAQDEVEVAWGAPCRPRVVARGPSAPHDDQVRPHETRSPSAGAGTPASHVDALRRAWPTT